MTLAYSEYFRLHRRVWRRTNGRNAKILFPNDTSTGGRFSGVLCGEETKVPHVMRISLIIVRRP